MLGKKVFNDYYWHYSLTPEQDDSVQQQIRIAEKLANIQAGDQYNVIKFNGCRSVSDK